MRGGEKLENPPVDELLLACKLPQGAGRRVGDPAQAVQGGREEGRGGGHEGGHAQEQVGRQGRGIKP